MTISRVVSDATLDEIRQHKIARQPRTIFFEEFAPNRVLQVIIHGDGDWGSDMAEALTNFMARRQRLSAPAVKAAHNSGEGDPSVTLDLAGADTPTETGSVT